MGPMAAPSLDDVAIFVRVVELGGFASAARAMGTPTSTVSRAIGRLESQTGVRLLQRTTRIMRPTSEGLELFASAGPALATLVRATKAVEPLTRGPRGRLRVTAPTHLASTFFSGVMVAFAEQYPQVELDVTLSNQHEDLVAGGFDVAIRAAGKLQDSSLAVRKLGAVEHGLYAAPTYLQKYGAPATPAELADRRCIVFRATDLKRTWALRGPEGDASMQVRGRISGTDFTFVQSILIAGGGIGLLPCFACAQDESTGRLVRVLPGYHARGATLYLLYPSTRNVPARVSAFCDFVSRACARWFARSSRKPE
jgi:DNA-binding transcriptional LysR family regulator